MCRKEQRREANARYLLNIWPTAGPEFLALMKPETKNGGRLTKKLTEAEIDAADRRGLRRAAKLEKLIFAGKVEVKPVKFQFAFTATESTPTGS